MVGSVLVFKCDCQYTWGHSHKDVLTTVTSGNSRLLIVIYCARNGLFLIGMITIATSVPWYTTNILAMGCEYSSLVVAIATHVVYFLSEMGGRSQQVIAGHE